MLRRGRGSDNSSGGDASEAGSVVGRADRGRSAVGSAPRGTAVRIGVRGRDMAYVPVGEVNGAAPQHWNAAEVTDFWIEIGQGCDSVGGSNPTVSDARAPVKKLILALGPLMSSEPEIAGATGTRARITVDDNGPGSFPYGTNPP